MKAVFLLLVATPLLVAQDGLFVSEVGGRYDPYKNPPPPVAQNGLFVESDPFGALVRVGDRLIEGRTPLLVRNLPPGSVRVSVFRDGYVGVDTDVEIPSTGFPRLQVPLERLTVPLSFPEEDELFPLASDLPGKSVQYRLKEGGYRLSLGEGRVRMDPIFPEEGQRQVAAWILPLTLGAATALTIRDINSPWIPTFPLSPATLTSYSLALFNAGWYLSLGFREARFRENLLAVAEPVSRAAEPAGPLFARGQRSLDEGNLELARTALIRVFEESPDSPWAAQALFLLSRIALVEGQIDQAVALYSSIIKIYPLQDLYDRTAKVLADLADYQGRPEEALRWLSLITYSDGFITQEDTADLRARLEVLP